MATIELEALVTKPMWKTLLIELVSSEKLDPWNIDIADITEKYIKKVKQMKVMELHLPANIILAAAILLRIKSDSLQLAEPIPVMEEQQLVDGMGISIPTLEIKGRILPPRKVTLPELMGALEEVMKDIDSRMVPKLIAPLEPIKLEFSEFDIDERMSNIMGRLSSGEGGMVTFTSLLAEHTPEEKVMTLLPLLHLWQKCVVALVQEEYFGEILIKADKGTLSAGADGGPIEKKQNSGEKGRQVTVEYHGSKKDN